MLDSDIHFLGDDSVSNSLIDYNTGGCLIQIENPSYKTISRLAVPVLPW
jgi:hypothetical protein